MSLQPALARRVPRCVSVFVLLFLAFVATQAASALQIVHVDSDAPAGGNGGSWDSAYADLPTALSRVNPTPANPVEIWIKRGTYKPTTGTDRNATFLLKSFLTLRGGFLGIEGSAAQRVRASGSETVLSGDIGTPDPDAVTTDSLADSTTLLPVNPSQDAVKDNSYNVVRAVGLSSITLDQVVITGGAALDEDMDSVKIESSVQLGSETGFMVDLESKVAGAGLFSVNSTLDITDCLFVRNTARGLGGAIAARNGAVSITESSFARNSSALAGGAVSLQDIGTTVVSGNKLYANSSGHLAGALWVQSSAGSPTVRGYLNQLLMGLITSTDLARLKEGLIPGLDPKKPLTILQLGKEGYGIGKSIYDLYQKVQNQAVGKAEKILGAQIGGAVASLGNVYAGVSIAVALIDFGVEIAKAFGVSANDPFILGWTQFSNFFNTYLSPTGWAKLLLNAILGEPAVDHNKLAQQIRNQDYKDNHNKVASKTFADNRFELNSSTGMGGAVVIIRANINLIRSHFINNEAIAGGGAVAAFGYNNVTIENSALTGNHSVLGHSAVSAGSRTILRCVNDAFVDNHSDSPFGRAVSIETGAEGAIGNSVLWNNTSGPNKTVGSDVFAARRDDLDDTKGKMSVMEPYAGNFYTGEPAGMREVFYDTPSIRDYCDSAGDARGAYFGTCIIHNCDIQGLDSLTLGSEYFGNFKSGLEYLTQMKEPNVGEGIAPYAVTSGTNFARDPMFLNGVQPHPLSPLVDAATTSILFSTFVNGLYDLNGNRRDTHPPIDIGPIENDGGFPADTVFYVNSARTTPAPETGLTWETSFKTLGAALRQPLTPGGQIWVAKGTYRVAGGDTTFTLKPGISLIGGFKEGDDDITQSQPLVNHTIISGETGNSGREDNTTTLLTGMEFLQRDPGGDVYSIYARRAALPRLIQGFEFTAAEGGPAVKVIAPVVIRNCSFYDNHGPDRALAIHRLDDHNRYAAQVIDSSFTGNSGGAIDSDVFNLDLVRSEFKYNTAPLGAGLYLHTTDHARRGSTRIERCVFVGNAATAGRGGAIHAEYDDIQSGRTLRIAHCVIAYNSATPAAGDSSNLGGAGLWLPTDPSPRGKSGVSITNSILWGNRLAGTFPATTLERQQLAVPIYPAYYNMLAPLLLNNDIEGLDQYTTLAGATGNIDFDPVFNSDYTVAADSMVLNRGAEYSSALDTTAAFGLAADMGAFENPTVELPRLFIPLHFETQAPTENGRIYKLSLFNGALTRTNFVWEVKRPGGGGYVPVVADAFTSWSGDATLTLTNPPYNWNGSFYRLRMVNVDGKRSSSTEVRIDIQPSILYVKAGGSGTRDGSSWDNAMATPAPALAISPAYTRIFVAAGDYTMLPSGAQPGVRLYGGFTGTESSASQRVRGANETILRCTTPDVPMIGIEGTAPLGNLIDGFTVKGAATVGTPKSSCISVVGTNTTFSDVRFAFAGIRQTAILSIRGTTVISDCSFTDGRATPVLASSGTLRVDHSTFTDNGITRVGGLRAGAILAEGGGGLTVTDSTFTNNSGHVAGAINHEHTGPFGPAGGLASIERCRFIGNSGGAGAVHLQCPGNHLIRNSVFSDNRAIPTDSSSGWGGAIRVARDAVLTVSQSTLVGNSAFTNGGAIDGTYLTTGSCTLIHSIVWGNSGPATGTALVGVKTITNSHVQGLTSYDPLLDPAGGSDHPLALGSPLINSAGTNATISGTTDLQGGTRFYNTEADLGSSEFSAPSPAKVYLRIRPTDQELFEERPASFSASASIGSNTGSTPVEWKYFDGTSYVPVSGLPGFTVSMANGVSTLAHPAVTLAMSGRKFMATFPAAPGVEIPFTLTVKPRLVLYVDGRIDPSGDGKSWATAFKTISQAFAAATADTNIWVATGDYVEANLTPPSGARLLVGFAGNETEEGQRNPTANPIRLGTPLADRSLVVDDTTTFLPPTPLNPGQEGRWQVDRGDGVFVDLTPDAWHTLTLINGVPGLTILGNPAFVGYRYRLVASENGAEVFTSLPATVTVIPRYLVYVDAGVTGGSHDGKDWENAFSDLSTALAAYPAFADFKVAEGTYVAPADGGFALRRSLTLTGGYLAGTETRDPAVHRTILRSPGSATSRATTLYSTADRGMVDSLSIIDGFVFRNAGLGIGLKAASPVIRNCRFEALVSAIDIADGNPVVENSIFTDQFDTAINNKGTSLLTVSGCHFERNGAGIPGRTVVYGSAIVVGTYATSGANNTRAKAVISDSTFSNNLAPTSGPAVAVSSAAVLDVTRCRFTTNARGGITAGPASTVDVRQSLFDHNGQGAINANGSLRVSFSTLALNSGGAAIDTYGNTEVRDSILWGNSYNGASDREEYQFRQSQGTSTLSHNIIQGLKKLAGTSLLPFDPRFADAPNGDFRLAPDSPAIDSGLGADLLEGETDLSNASRLSGAAPDLGAFEAATGTTPEYGFVLPASLSGPVGSTLTVAHTAPPGSSVVWQYSSDGIAWSSINPTGGSASSPPGASASVKSLSQLTLASIKPPLDGISLRLVLDISGISYISQTISVSVVPFKTLYVDANAASPGDGRTWDTAFKNLSDALNSADQVHRKIEIARGTYHAPAASFQLSGFEVRGGWPTGGIGPRDPAANETILTGVPAGGGTRAPIVVTIAPGGLIPALLEGVTIENGGTGIRVGNTLPDLRDLIVRGNSNTGLVVESNPPLSGGRVENSIFENNTGVQGGGIRLDGSVPTLERVIVRGNTAAEGGGIHVSSQGPVFTSLLVTGNVADTGGGVYAAAAARFDQATIAGNRSRVSAGIHGRTTVSLRDSIVWGNRATEAGSDPQLGGNHPPSVYTNLSRTIVEQTSVSSGVMFHDPIFVSPVDAASAPTTAGDYRLRAVSPAIDAGDDAVVTGRSLDIAGNPRVVANVDLGAYESPFTAPAAPLAVTRQPENLQYRIGGTNNTFTVAGTGAESIRWEYALPGGEWLTLVGVSGFSGADSATLVLSSLGADISSARIRAVLTSADGSKVYSEERTLTVYSPRYYVNANRNGSEPENGLTWATAYRSLDAVLALPYDSEGTEIWIAAGTYRPATSFVLRPGTSVYGGFAGTETQLSDRDLAAHVTAFAGSAGSSPIVSIPFVNVTMQPVRITDVTFRDSGSYGISYGANFPLNLDRVHFTRLGTGLYQTSGTANITRSSFTSNQSAIYSKVSALDVRLTEFRGNGGGNGTPVVHIPQGGQSQLFENCLFAGNSTTSVYTRGLTTLRHVSLVNNLGGTALDAGSNVTLNNSIIWGNRTAGSTTVPAQAAGSISGASNVIELATSLEPIFVGPVPAAAAPTLLGDYQLDGASHVIESGTNAESNTSGTDLAGAPRLHGAQVDPGAYEYQSDPYFITPPANAVATIGGTVRYTVSATAVVESYTWQESVDGTTWTPLTDGAVFAGSNTAALSVTGDKTLAGHRYRAVLRFPDGPELPSEAARYDFVSLDSVTTAGFATPAVFTSTASGNVTSYQWQVSVNGGPFANVANDPAHSGATTPVLTIAGNSAFTNRTYRVRVTFSGSPTTNSNSLAYLYAEFTATPSGVVRNGTLAYGGSGFGFELPGIDTATLNPASVSAQTRFSGRAGLTAPVVTGSRIAFEFLKDLHAGEHVTVTTSAALTAGGITARPQVWEFVKGVRSGAGVFDHTAPVSGAPAAATTFALADLDGDANASIDAVVAGPAGNQVYLNDGSGNFSASGPAFGAADATSIVLGSFTSAGRLDAAIANADGSIGIWSNNGSGVFVLLQTIPAGSARTLALGDLDADGDLDLFVALSGGNRVCLNNGSGGFSATGSVFGGNSGTSVAIGDVDNDGRLDALVGAGTTSSLWINQGNGTFNAASQSFANRPADRVAIADFDRDGFPDLVFTRTNAATQIWQNQKNGTFAPSSTSLGGGNAALATGDTNGDDIPDIILTDATGAIRTWSGGGFSRTENQPQLAFDDRIQLADLNGDGALDLFGLDVSGQPAGSLYRVVTSTGDEDTAIPLTSTGFTRETAAPVTHVRIASLPSLGSLSDGAATVGIGRTFTLAEAAALTFQPGADLHGFDSFTWLASTDGTNFDPAPVSYWLIIVPQADAVVPGTDSIILAQGGTATTLDGGGTSVLANDANVDPGTTLSASLVGRPAHGTLSLNTDGTFSYHHDGGETRSDQFTYRARNNTSGRFDDAVVTIAIGNINDAPVSIDFAEGGTLYTGQPAGTTAGSLAAIDPDPEDEGLLTFSVTSGDGFTIEGDVLKTSATLDASAGLSREVVIRATDPAGLFVEKAVTISLTRPPTALAAGFTTDEDSSTATPLGGTDGAAALAYEIVDAPAHGSLTGSGADISYQPDLDFNGTDIFTFRVTDGVIVSAPATVIITVDPVNDAPVLAGAELPDTTDELPTSVTLTGADVDGGAPQYWIETQGNHGTSVIDGTTLTYTPTRDTVILPTYDWVIIYAYDNGGLRSMTQSVRVLVTPVNDAPVLAVTPTSSQTDVPKGTPITFKATVTDHDSTSTLALTTPPASGSLEIQTDGTVIYTNNPGFTGTDSFTLTATDGELDSVPVTLVVSIIDPAPVASDTSVTGDQRTTLRTFLNGYDIQGDGLTAAIVSGPAHGTVSLAPLHVPGHALASYEAAYTPDADFSGTDSLTFTMTDAGGNVSEPATATFIVREVNAAPVALPVTKSQSGLLPVMELILSGTDTENSPLNYRIVTPPQAGTLSGSGPDFTYTPATSPFEGGDSFTYVVNDGARDSAAATVTLTFTNEHPDPTTAPDTATVYRGLNAEIDVLANDSDPWGNPLFIAAVTPAAHGTVTRTGSGATARIIYQHDGGDATEDSFTYTLSNFETTIEQEVYVTIKDRTIIVDNSADSGPGTLREAFDTVNRLATTPAAPDNAFPVWTIEVHPYQTPGEPGLRFNYDLQTAGEADELLGDSALFLRGKATIEASSAYPIVIRRSAYADAMRVLHITPSAEATLKNITFAGGKAHEGAGIYNEGKLTLENVELRENTATSLDGDPGAGGGLFNRNAPVTLAGVRFNANLADDAAGLHNLADGPFKSAVITATEASFSGQAPVTDFRSVALNGGSASILAGDLTAQTPTAPWFGPIGDTTIRKRFSTLLPVVLGSGHTLAFSADDIPAYQRSVTIGGSGASRTLTAIFADTLAEGFYPASVTASGSGVTFTRQFDLTLASGSDQTPVLRDDYLAARYQEDIDLTSLALANDEDPDGTPLTNISIVNGPGSGTLYYQQGMPRLYVNGDTTVKYTVSGTTSSAVIHVRSNQPRNPGVTTGDDSGPGSLREGIDLSNTYTAQSWSFKPSGLARPLVEASGIGDNDPDTGASAYLIKGNVVIDGTNQPGFLIRRTDGAPAMRLFHIAPGATLTLKNLTVENGLSTAGGAIYNEGTLILEGAILQNNTASATETTAGLGGAIYNAGGTVTTTGSSLLSNTAESVTDPVLPGLGAAIFTFNGTVTLNGTSIMENTAGEGAALFAEGNAGHARVYLTNSRLGKSFAASDLNSRTSAGGQVSFQNRTSSIDRITGPWISPIPDLVMDSASRLDFFANDLIPGMSIHATSGYQAVVPDSGLVITGTGLNRRLAVNGALSGLSNIHITATDGGVSYDQTFIVAADTGVVTNPTANPDVAEIYPTQSAVIDVVANDTDPLGLRLLVTSVTAPAHGTATIMEDGRISYTHTGTASPGTDEFFYTVSNGFGGTATIGVQIRFKVSTRTVTTIYELATAINEINATPALPWTIVINAGVMPLPWNTFNAVSDGEYYTAFRIAGNITIDASSSPGFTLFSPPGGGGGPPSRAFSVNPGASLTLKNLSLSGGNVQTFGSGGVGGAVRNRGTFNADHVTFLSNNATSGDARGGALYNDGGTAVLTDCVFTSNTATGTTGRGGAIVSKNGSLALTRVTFSGNKATTSADDLYLFADGNGTTASLLVTETTVPAFETATFNGGTLSLTGITANAAPVFAGYAVSTAYQTPTTISLSKLLAKTTDTDPVSVLSVGSPTNGGSVSLQSTGILYTPRGGFSGTATFAVVLADSRGARVAGTVAVTVRPASEGGGVGANTPELSFMPGGNVSLTFHAIPGRGYLLQRSTDMINWDTIATLTADGTGNMEFTDEDPPKPNGFYRLKRP
ncbi:tandem-95 repeat protein [Luteolibacter yonseiensis]|uniref:Tandem-95 repeat protein n=1 Tax=Luteolibacter yonseiensis TaxID=1144680 RepID=A0A934R4I4_9BACT|nr:Ig-like domain-containing protein [Luteolibacter yonseiensis]MBK1817001.1 tandem-95 repeat protein [Luteolibacter yonseiensis]